MRRAILLAAVLTPCLLQAQGNIDPRTPRAANELLAGLEGTWLRPGQAADSFSDTCAWLEGGRRHMVCAQRAQSPFGPVQQQTTYSYRGRDSSYVVTALLATGQVWTYVGRPQGNRWTFNSQNARPGSTQQLGVIVTVARDTLHFVEESSENGATWTVTEDYRYVRKRP